MKHHIVSSAFNILANMGMEKVTLKKSEFQVYNSLSDSYFEYLSVS